MIFSQYGTGQRAGFGLVSVAFCLCLIGSIAPYWLTAQTKISNLSGDLGPIGSLVGQGLDSLFTVRMGVWYYCIEALGEQDCGSSERVDDSLNSVRGLVFLNILLSFIMMCVACCRCVCCGGGRTICHGILSFIAGGFGCAAFITSYNKSEKLMSIPLLDVSYGWAIYFFTFGSILMVVAAFLLCFSMPVIQNHGGVVLAQGGPSVSVNVNNVNTNTNMNHMTNNYMPSPTSFESLPHGPPPQYAAANTAYPPQPTSTTSTSTGFYKV